MFLTTTMNIGAYPRPREITNIALAPIETVLLAKLLIVTQSLTRALVELIVALSAFGRLRRVSACSVREWALGQGQFSEG